jgi:transcriptional regulator with XRE-family HTH domain
MPGYVFDGQKLKGLCDDRGLRLGQLAARVNRSESLVKLWVYGFRAPTAAMCVELTAVLDCDVADFFTEKAGAVR